MDALPHRFVAVVVALLRRLVEGVVAMAALLHRLMADVADVVVKAALAQRPIEALQASFEESTSFLAALHSVGASKSSKTRSSSEMQLARARA